MLREAVSNVSGALSLPLLQRAVAPPGLQESALGALGALGADSKAYRAWTWETYKRYGTVVALSHPGKLRLNCTKENLGTLRGIHSCTVDEGS
eukprot:1161438-Pelagomonas_calceolata.AAC.1